MKISLRHTLRFSLGTPARAVQHLLLTALNTPQQKVERWSIEMPGFAEAAMFRDGFGNRAHLVSQVKPESEIAVIVGGVVETFDKAGVLGRLEYDMPPAIFRRPTPATKMDPAAVAGLPAGGGRIALLHELMGQVHLHLAGAQSQSQGGQRQTQGGASAADHAHGFIASARALDIPARYVTGYLIEDDKATFHAWAEAWDDGLGWIGFDPTHDVCPAETYIRLASGLDASSTMPIRSVPVWAQMPEETIELDQDPST